MLSWVGKTENPPKSNNFPPVQHAVQRLLKAGVKIPRWQTAGGFAWCVWANFVAYAVSGSKSAIAEIQNSNAAWTVRVLQDAEAKANGLSVTKRPMRGDIVLFDLPAGANVDHSGLLLSWDRLTVTCVEGNTSSGALGSQANGGGVYIRTRPRANVRAFVRVKG